MIGRILDYWSWVPQIEGWGGEVKDFAFRPHSPVLMFCFLGYEAYNKTDVFLVLWTVLLFSGKLNQTFMVLGDNLDLGFSAMVCSFVVILIVMMIIDNIGDIFWLCLQIDNEENALVCLRIIIELTKQFRPAFSPEVTICFLPTIKGFCDTF